MNKRVLIAGLMGVAVLSPFGCFAEGIPQDGDVLLYMPFDDSMDTVMSISENDGNKTTGGTPAYDDDVYRMYIVENGNPAEVARQGKNAAALKASRARITHSVNHAYMKSSDFNCATIEFFMKGSSHEDEITTWGNKFSIGSGSRCGLMIQADDNKKYYVKVQTDSQETLARSPFYMNDGKWHHFAVVIEPVNNGADTRITWYFDYANKVETTKSGVWAGFRYNQTLTFGQSGNNVVWMDELRITKGVVGPQKFMRFASNPNPQSGDTLFFLPLDGDMDSTAPFFTDDIGAVEVLNGTPVYDTGVWKTHIVEYGNPDVAVRKTRNGGCLKAEKGQVSKKIINPFLTAGDILESATIEFFMKGSPVDAEVATWENKLSLGNDNKKCGFMVQATEDKRYYLRVDTDLTTVAGTSSFKMTDGKWHHFAVAIEPVNDGTQTKVTYYFDYEKGYESTKNGIWSGLKNDQHLTFGSAKSVLWLDEFRISKGVLPKDKFLKARNMSGFKISVR